MQIETAVLRLWGQLAAGPTALVDQSKARMRAPISPPPLRKLISGDSDAQSCCLVGVELIFGFSQRGNRTKVVLDGGGCWGKTLETVYIFLSIVFLKYIVRRHLPAIRPGKNLLYCVMNLVGSTEQNQHVVDLDSRFRTGIDLGVAVVNDGDY